MTNYKFDFILSLTYWIGFAYDIEYDRDFWTWMWLFAAIFFLGKSFTSYAIEKIKNNG